MMLNMSVDIRACTDDDLELLRLRWRTPGEVHEWHYAQQLDGHVTYLVAWRGDIPLGSGSVQWGGCVGSNAKRSFPNALELNHLHVRSEFRGQGVGSNLIGTAEKLVRKTGWDQFSVSVAVDNPKAERLYLRLGFRPTGVFDVSEYDWVTDQGAVKHEVERSQLLVKDLGGFRTAW